MIRKSEKNKFNLKHGMAFAYRMGDLVDSSVGNAIQNTHLKAPELQKEPDSNIWYQVPVKDGISGDGSAYHIYIRKGNSKNLCIFFSGGGVAWDEYTAARPVTGGKLAAGLPNYYWNNLRPLTQLMNIHIGITDTDNAINPFREWNFVIITYATGDFHIGQSEFPYVAEDGSSQSVHFNGHTNFEGAMDVAVKHFPNVQKMLIAGDSAGAFAVPALAGEIIENYYDNCKDITLFSDSGQLLYSHWKKTAREIWKADKKIWEKIHTPNITMDWYNALHDKYGEKIRYLYASSTHDYLLSAYYNDITYKKYRTNSDVQDAFYTQLQEMAENFKAMSDNSGIFINEWKNLTLVYPGLRGGTVHTAVRHMNFYVRTKSGISMAKWLFDAVNGNVYDVGSELL